MIKLRIWWKRREARLVSKASVRHTEVAAMYGGIAVGRFQDGKELGKKK
jgi:hypothetical protein